MKNGRHLLGGYKVAVVAARPIAVAIAGAVVASLLAACASTPLEPAGTAEQRQIAQVLNKISDASTIAVNAQSQLALTSDAKMQGEMIQRRRLLTDVVSYDFYGDVETLLNEIALKYGYSFERYGKRPPEGLNVNIFLTKKPVVEVLRQVGITSNVHLDIVLKPTVLELHYKSK